jgi:hypothetical protein
MGGAAGAKKKFWKSRVEKGASLKDDVANSTTTDNRNSFTPRSGSPASEDSCSVRFQVDAWMRLPGAELAVIFDQAIIEYNSLVISLLKTS